MLVIRLARTSSKNRTKYRVLVADSRRSLTGRFIEILGYFNPLSKDNRVAIDKVKYEAWIQKGAKPSQRVKSLFSKLN